LIVENARLTIKQNIPKINPVQAAKELWAYIDTRDAAHSFSLALDFLRDKKGFFDSFIITAPDTYSSIPTLELIKEFYQNLSQIPEFLN